MVERVCTKCARRKPLEEFDKDKRQPAGRRSMCKICEARRPSNILKHMKSRIKVDKNYTGLECILDEKDIEKSLLQNCFFCDLPIKEAVVFHRKKSDIGYVLSNIVIAHFSCHARYHAQKSTRDSKGKFNKGKRG